MRVIPTLSSHVLKKLEPIPDSYEVTVKFKKITYRVEVSGGIPINKNPRTLKEEQKMYHFNPSHHLLPKPIRCKK